MKAFFITLAVIAVGSVALMANYERIAGAVADSISVGEGFAQIEKKPGFEPGLEFEQLKNQNPDAFGQKYRPYLEKRMKLVKFFMTFGKYDLCQRIIGETMARYEYSFLDRDPAFAKIVYFNAKIYDDKDFPREALEWYDRYIKEYPEYEDIKDAQKRSINLHIRLRV